MRTESKKSFVHGFLLTEAEVRRLAADLHEQLARDTSHFIISSFEVQFRDGTIAHPANLDDVLRENNSGPALITRFRMTFSLDEGPPRRVVSIEFANSWYRWSNSVTYTVTSEERDWAFVVVSRIEDRLAAIKRRPNFYLLMIMLPPILVAIGVLFLGLYLQLPLGDAEVERLRQDLQLSEISRLGDEWNSGRLTDPVIVFLRGLEISIRPTIPSELAHRYEIGRNVALVVVFLMIGSFLAIIGVEFFFPDIISIGATI